MKIISALLALWLWTLIAGALYMALNAPELYHDPAGYVAMALFILYFAVFVTPYAFFNEDTIRENDMDLALLFWPIILAMAIAILPPMMIFWSIKGRVWE